MGGGKDERVCQSASPSHLLYKGSQPGVEELLAEWHSCLTEQNQRQLQETCGVLFTAASTRRAFPIQLNQQELKVRDTFFYFICDLLCTELMTLSLLLWGQGTSVGTRTGYLSAYISSTAPHLCDYKGSVLKASNRAGSSCVVYFCFAVFDAVSELNSFSGSVELVSRAYFEPLVGRQCPSRCWPEAQSIVVGLLNQAKADLSLAF